MPNVLQNMFKGDSENTRTMSVINFEHIYNNIHPDPFHVTGPFFYSLKTSENLWFFNVFGG